MTCKPALSQIADNTRISKIEKSLIKAVLFLAEIFKIH